MKGKGLSLWLANTLLPFLPIRREQRRRDGRCVGWMAVLAARC